MIVCKKRLARLITAMECQCMTLEDHVVVTVTVGVSVALEAMQKKEAGALH